MGKGDVIACPSGGSDVAHQLINSGDIPLRYFALSTAIDTDVFSIQTQGSLVWLPDARQGRAR